MIIQHITDAFGEEKSFRVDIDSFTCKIAAVVLQFVHHESYLLGLLVISNGSFDHISCADTFVCHSN
jgi:hypothetical protein